jgi:hypothetical protein
MLCPVGRSRMGPTIHGTMRYRIKPRSRPVPITSAAARVRYERSGQLSTGPERKPLNSAIGDHDHDSGHICFFGYWYITRFSDFARDFVRFLWSFAVVSGGFWRFLGGFSRAHRQLKLDLDHGSARRPCVQTSDSETIRNSSILPKTITSGLFPLPASSGTPKRVLPIPHPKTVHVYQHMPQSF